MPVLTPSTWVCECKSLDVPRLQQWEENKRSVLQKHYVGQRHSHMLTLKGLIAKPWQSSRDQDTGERHQETKEKRTDQGGKSVNIEQK